MKKKAGRTRASEKHRREEKKIKNLSVQMESNEESKEVDQPILCSRGSRGGIEW